MRYLIKVILLATFTRGEELRLTAIVIPVVLLIGGPIVLELILM